METLIAHCDGVSPMSIFPMGSAHWQAAGEHAVVMVRSDGRQPAEQALEFAGRLTANELLNTALTNVIARAWMAGYRQGRSDAADRRR